MRLKAPNLSAIVAVTTLLQVGIVHVATQPNWFCLPTCMPAGFHASLNSALGRRNGFLIPLFGSMTDSHTLAASPTFQFVLNRKLLETLVNQNLEEKKKSGPVVKLYIPFSQIYKEQRMLGLNKTGV